MAGEGIGEAAGEAGEGIIGPISPIGAAGFAFSVGMGIYSQIEKEKFQKALLAQLSELSNQIASLQANIKAFEGNADFKSALEKKEFPFSNIDTVFNSYNPGETLEESTITENQLEAVNTNIEAIIDLVENGIYDQLKGKKKPLLTLFITSLTKQISPGTNNYNGKSILEAAYSYYKNYVLLQLYKGLFLIKVFNFKTADSWKNKLTNQDSHNSSVNKMGNTTQAAVKEQLLLNQGIKWMDLRGLEGVNGDLLANFKEEQLRYVMCDNILTLPEDHVVVGYEFEKINTHHSFFDKKDNITALRIIVHHGKINAFGFVQDVTTSIQGLLPADCTTPEYTGYLEDVRFIYNGKIEIPEDSPGKDFVITNLYFKVFENDFPKWRGNNYTLKTKVLSLVIEYHELQITKNLSSTNVPTYDIKMINKQTKSCPYADSNFVFKESLQGIFNALESKGGENNAGALGFDFFNSDNDYFHYQHRSFYIPKNLDTSGWNTPITGVKIKNNHLAFKSDFRKNMFNK